VEPDDTTEASAGPLDAGLLFVGAAVVIAGLTTLLPAWTIAVGAVAFVLGGALMLRRFGRSRRDAERHVKR
jgi:Flp pilus assembly protein TadB